MKASTERKLIRWIHLILSIPIIGYIYGPVASIPEAVAAVRWVFMPMVNGDSCRLLALAWPKTQKQVEKKLINLLRKQ